MAKGEHNQECNRTACDNTEAIFYNYSTKKYYCSSCAEIINGYNHNDAMRLFGHELCLLEEEQKEHN